MIALNKEKGNAAFKIGNFQEALNAYNEIIDSYPNKNLTDQKQDFNEYITCLNNRSLCYLKLENYENAFKDANDGILK